MASKLRETDLYPPVKRFLEAQGYEVKAEVGSCDVMAVRGSEPPVIVELKTSFLLSLIYQAMDRQAVTDHVYVAFPLPEKGISREELALCRRLGFGLLAVREQWVEPYLDPAPYAPRKFAARRHKLLKEFHARLGDNNSGGSSKRKLMTAYRQDALRCTDYLHCQGPSRVKDIVQATGVARAPGILRSNVYGWFEKQDVGIYSTTPAGKDAIATYQDVVALMRSNANID